MTEETLTSNNLIDDVQGLEIETFKVEQLEQLDVDAALTISACSSTTSSSCG